MPASVEHFLNAFSHLLHAARSMRRGAFVATPKPAWTDTAQPAKVCRRRTVVCADGSKSARGSTAALLVAVPLLWGSYGAAVKLLGDMPAVLVNAGDVGFAALFATAAARGEKSDLRARIAAAELAVYLFAASNLNLQALNNLSASRAAFWVQLTSVFVPAAAALTGERLPRLLPPAAVLAALGAAVIARDSASAPLGFGDCAGVLAAVAYSAHALRLEMLTLAGVVTPQAALVRDTYAAESVLTLSAAGFAATRPGEAQSFLATIPGLSLGELVGAAAGLIWIGVGTSALATWAQAAGQARVGPSRAAVVYAAQPVCAMIIAFCAGVETPTANEIIGGILISAAAVVAAGSGGERELIEADSDVPV